jgi:hypothetical protein
MAIMTDGHPTTIEFAADSDVQLKVKELTPIGIDGGGAIDITTMDNTTWRTMAPKSLKTASEMNFVCAYDPAVYNEMISMVNVNQLITITFPDGETVEFYGFINTFTPNAHVEGEQPTANVTIIPTNRNGSGVETAPVYSAA